MVRSLVDLNRSLGSAMTCFFLELTDAEGLFLSLCRVIETPWGNWRAGRRQDLASALLREVLYYNGSGQQQYTDTLYLVLTKGI